MTLCGLKIPMAARRCNSFGKKNDRQGPAASYILPNALGLLEMMINAYAKYLIQPMKMS